jgi:hypothetical protein
MQNSFHTEMGNCSAHDNEKRHTVGKILVTT